MELEGSLPRLQVPLLVHFLSQINYIFSTVGIISSSKRTSSCFISVFTADRQWAIFSAS